MCEWIDNYVSEKGQMTPEAFTVSVHNINFLFASYVIQIFIFFLFFTNVFFLQRMVMKDELIETERVRAIQEVCADSCSMKL